MGLCILAFFHVVVFQNHFLNDIHWDSMIWPVNGKLQDDDINVTGLQYVLI